MSCYVENYQKLLFGRYEEFRILPKTRKNADLVRNFSGIPVRDPPESVLWTLLISITFLEILYTPKRGGILQLYNGTNITLDCEVWRTFLINILTKEHFFSEK